MIYAGVGVMGGSGLSVYAALLAGRKSLWFVGYLALSSFDLHGVIIIAAELGTL